MGRSRTITALAGLAFGIAVSVAAWVYLDTLLLFLFLPFVPFLFGGGSTGAERTGTAGPPRSSTVRECPECSFRTTESEFEYCPRDGRRLRERDDR